MRPHQFVADFVLDLVDVGLGRIFGDFEQQLAGERIAVGVQSGGRQSENDIADFDRFAGHDFFALDDAHDKSGKIVFALGVEAGHLGRLAADQRAAIVFAGVGKSFDDFLGDFGFEFSRGQVIHEEQRCGALHGDVVDAVIDQVRSDGVVDLHFEGDFEFSADAIDARDENGIEIFLVYRKQAAEPADLAEHAARKSLVREVLDPLLGSIGAIDVDACIGVRDRTSLRVRSFGPKGIVRYESGGRLVTTINSGERLDEGHFNTFSDVLIDESLAAGHSEFMPKCRYGLLEGNLCRRSHRGVPGGGRLYGRMSSPKSVGQDKTGEPLHDRAHDVLRAEGQPLDAIFHPQTVQ